MSDYSTKAKKLSNLQDVHQQIRKFVFDSAVQDREIIFTNWIEMLIEVGATASVTQSAKLIGNKVGMTHQAVTHYYRGARV